MYVCVLSCQVENGLPFPFPVNLANPGIEPVSHVLAGRFFTVEPPGKKLAMILAAK